MLLLFNNNLLGNKMLNLNIINLIKYTSPLKLLYVEDNQEAMETSMLIFEEFFDDISVACTGEEGLKKFDDNDIDLIITDINMPNMNGIEMIKEIRKINSEVPILVLSANNESKYFMQSIKLGVEGYLLKPIDMDQFIGILEKVTNKIKLKVESQRSLKLLSEYKEAIDNASIVAKTNVNGIITYVNDQFCKLSGYTKNELIGKPHSIVKSSDSLPFIYKDLWNTIKVKKQIWKGTLKNLTKDGESYYINVTIKPIFNNLGEIIEYIGISNDVTTLVSLNNEVKFLRDYDIEQQRSALEKLEVGIINHFNEDEVKIINAPLDILGGDFYSLFRCNKGSTFIYLIDGQGHGISPALTVFSVSSTINKLIGNVKSLDELVGNIFPGIKAFLGDVEQLSYTMIMIDEASKTISYSSGGMYPFLIKTKNEIFKIKANNIPYMNFSTTPVVDTIDIKEWDSLVVYTDGLIEHKNKELSVFTPEKIITDSSLIDDAIEVIDKCKSDLNDDITLIQINNISQN